MTVTGEIVLLTGATGFIGFRTLIDALKAGYHVRAAVRNENGIQKIKAAKSTQPYLNHLTFVLVPDILDEDAYNEAVKGVSYIIHLASPTTNQASPPTEETYDSVLIQPALRGTLNLIKAAHLHSPTTKRIVITASIVSIVPWSAFFSETGTVFTERSRTATPSGPFGHIFAAYAASKVAALNAAEEYVRVQHPHFDVNHIGPAFVIGRHELATSRAEVIAGTNAAALGHVIGAGSGPTPSTSVFVDDVARMHVRALDAGVPGGQFFLGVSEGSDTRWDDALDIVRKYFPEAVERGVFSMQGTNETKRLVFDNEYTKKTLGVEFMSFEEQVRSVAGQYVELEE